VFSVFRVDLTLVFKHIDLNSVLNHCLYVIFITPTCTTIDKLDVYVVRTNQSSGAFSELLCFPRAFVLSCFCTYKTDVGKSVVQMSSRC